MHKTPRAMAADAINATVEMRDATPADVGLINALAALHIGDQLERIADALAAASTPKGDGS